MLRRGLAFSLLLAMASAAQAGVIVDLVPATAGPYAQDESVDVDIMLRQDPTDGDHSLRFIQFDFNTTAPELTLIPPTIHRLASSPNIRFWNFVGVTNCSNSEDAACGSGHFLEDVLNGPRGRILSATYFFTDPADLGENTTAQRILRGNGDAVKVGVMRVKMPLQDGVFMLDVVNATETNPDVGGVDVRWGFGLNVNGEPLTTWRANTGEITGGTMEMCVGAVCECTAPELVSSAPACDSALPRSQGNVIRLTFSGDVGTAPSPGDIIVSALDAGGPLTGPDLSGTFTYSLEAGNTILRMEESIPGVLSNLTWYTIQNTGGWTGACPFEVTYVSMPGNVNNDRFTNFGDLSGINANRTGSPADDDPYNVNADGNVNFGDMSLANTFIVSTKPDKPPGHDCAP